jgi:hypothetical protein
MVLDSYAMELEPHVLSALSPKESTSYWDDVEPSLALHIVAYHFTKVPRCTQHHSYTRPGYSIWQFVVLVSGAPCGSGERKKDVASAFISASPGYCRKNIT